MVINRDEYLSKVLGCWMGKNIGGTLGMPFEWKRQINDVSFYVQDPGGEPLPNDDLDIALLWLIALEEKGIELDPATLAEYWLLYITPNWSEYGTAKANMRAGLVPPLCGTVNNVQKDSCGSFIRSEIWACITPGFPRLAARYAYNDAIVDHGDGEGVYAEMFCAALESMAFIEKDLNELIRIGLSYIPSGCGVAKAIRCVLESYQTGLTWLEARDELLVHYRGSVKFNTIAQRDVEKGFDSGQPGWDAPANVGIAMLGLLFSEGDFGKLMSITVNCGEDTDCTAATAGSIFGLLHGIAAIPQEWITPIGRSIKTACLNLGELDEQVPPDVDDLTTRTERIMQQVLLRHKLPLEIAAGKATDLAGLNSELLMAGPETTALLENLGCPVYHFDFLDVVVDYGDAPVMSSGATKIIRLRIFNTYKVQTNLTLRCYAPEGWRVHPARSGPVFIPHHWLSTKPTVVEFSVEAERMTEPVNRLVVEITSPGRPTVMLVPIMLLNGDMAPAPQG